jgi:hypothetical protein
MYDFAPDPFEISLYTEENFLFFFISVPYLRHVCYQIFTIIWAWYDWYPLASEIIKFKNDCAVCTASTIVHSVHCKIR